MNLPSNYSLQKQWTFVGPMGPRLPSSLLSHSILGVDGGAHFCDHMDLWVGDGDSYNKEVNATHLFKHPPEKAQSDLALALGLFQETLPYKFHLWGFLGGRTDHELFNLGEALTFLENHPESQILFYDGNGQLRFHLIAQGHWKFNRFGPFSIGTLKNTTVKLTGSCHYPLPRSITLRPLSSLGLSNQGEGEIEIENGGPLFLHFPEEK